MALKTVQIGARVLVVDNDNKVMFTKGDWIKAEERYRKELARKITKEL